MIGELLTFIAKRKHIEQPEQLRAALQGLRPSDVEDESNARCVKFSWEVPTTELANRVALLCGGFFTDHDHFDIAFYP